MENFKAYLTIEGSAKKEEIRRFTVDSDVATNFLYLRERIQCIFPILRGKRFIITWKDIEGDQITISSDEELRIALQESPEGTNHKIFVVLRPEEDKNIYVRLEEEGVVHKHIMCDGCNNHVRGFRYKCMECPDYDLCSQCEGKGLHAEHCMLRTAEPLQWSSRYGRRVAHHMKKFIRNSVLYTGKEENVRECPVTKERHRRCRGPNCNSPSVVETLVDFLSDPPNYAGECPMRSNVSKPPETATEATTLCDKPQSQEEKTETNESIDLLKYLENTIAPVLNQLGINVNLNVKDDEKSESKPNNGSTTQADSKEAQTINEQSAPKPNNGATNQTDSKRAPIINEQSVPNQETSTKNEKSGKSSDDDEWTILNKEEKSLNMDTSSSLKRTDGNMSPEAVTPSAPVREPSNGNLYPSLPQLAASQPILYHPNPNIQSAIVSMMEMGFSNEHGSLTQLLVLKDGDINKVLDILSPK